MYLKNLTGRDIFRIRLSFFSENIPPLDDHYKKVGLQKILNDQLFEISFII